MLCHFEKIENHLVCNVCGFKLRVPTIIPVHRNCPNSSCPYLGQPSIDSSGVKIRVKCTCPNSDGTKEQWYQAHTCTAPEYKRSSGKHGVCLPEMTKKFDTDHAQEASLYHLCQVDCSLKPV